MNNDKYKFNDNQFKSKLQKYADVRNYFYFDETQILYYTANLFDFQKRIEYFQSAKEKFISLKDKNRLNLLLCVDKNDFINFVDRHIEIQIKRKDNQVITNEKRKEYFDVCYEIKHMIFTLAFNKTNDITIVKDYFNDYLSSIQNNAFPFFEEIIEYFKDALLINPYEDYEYIKLYENLFMWIENKYKFYKNKIDNLFYNDKIKNTEHISYKYVNIATNFNALNSLYHYLIDNNFISKDTKSKDFRNIFDNKKPSNPIKWIGNISELAYFIKYLHNECNLIEKITNDIWKVTAKLFIDGSTGKPFEKEFRTQKTPAKAEIIEKGVNLLK